MVQKVKDILKKMNENPIPLCIVSPFFLVLVIEMFHRRSVQAGFAFILSSPLQYLVNVVLVMSMLLLCLFARRRLFWTFLIGLLWMILGVANYLVLLNRVSPLSWADVGVLTSVISIIKQYLTKFQIVAIIFALVFCILLSLYLYHKVPKVRRRQYWKRDVLGFALAAAGGAVIYGASVNTNLFENTGNITLTFEKSGFCYSFANSVVDTGIKRPLNYSEQAVADICRSLRLDNDWGQEGNEKKKSAPNVVFVQLESFFDLGNLWGYQFSEDPMPNFHGLLQNYTSGLLRVPALGAGTVNTEFEVLTGMSLRFFGLCEYPYKTILQEQTCESLAYNLQERGYATAVVHNNRGSFYSRHEVFEMLGFEVFDSVEYMNGLSYNPIGFARDEILTSEILTRMEMTEEPDFIYTITVQSHGKYPAEPVDETQTITLSGGKDESRKNQFEYFANQCKQVDDFIGELIAAVKDCGEDTVIVFFGDHLPTLGIEDSQLKYQDSYQTTYIIWDNFDLPRHDENLAAYQLSAAVMERLGYANGIMTKYHQKCKNSPDYLKGLELLQYDMLYGEHYVYGGVDRYDPTDLHMGYYDIAIENVRQGADAMVVTGGHFTESSRIYVNGKKQDTKFINEKALMVRGFELEEGDRIRVKQITSTGGSLGGTEDYIWLDSDK